MKSISLKVTVWSAAALILSLAAFMFIGRIVVGESAARDFTQVNQILFRHAVGALQAGGMTALTPYMHDLNRSPGIQFEIADASGRDLVTAEDRSELLRSTIGSGRPFFEKHNRITMGLRSEDGRYTWFVTSRVPSPILLAPFYVLLLATVAVLYWLVRAYITRPIRQLAVAVDRFGAGELTARATPCSNDEIGNLSRSFNAMAKRTQALLMTERQLLQDVSHELRSPLARLTFEAEMVRKTNDRDASANRLRHEVERLSQLVETLIDMARAEGEPGTIDMDDLSLNDLILATTEDCDVEARERNCTIMLTAPQRIFLRANAELLHRAFENVIRNAIRYAPPETAVEVELKSDRDLAFISVRDRGPGIPIDMTEKIFDPFFRADPSRDANTGGLGLGLAIARRAVRIHCGDITAANASPGALLRIALPLHPASGV